MRDTKDIILVLVLIIILFASVPSLFQLAQGTVIESFLNLLIIIMSLGLITTIAFDMLIED